MRVVILGAQGCFGLNLAMHLAQRNVIVTGVGRQIFKPEPYTLDFKMNYMCYHLVEQFEEAWEAIEGLKPDAIISFAAHAGLVPQSWIYPEAFYATNTLLPVKIAKRLPKTTRYIHVGSSEVYGSNDFPVGEDAPIRCSSPYAVSKAAADLHLMTLKDNRITIVRPSNCYCPGQALYRLIPRAVYACLTGKKMPIQGSPQKSYLHAQDLSEAIYMLLENPKPGIFNVGSEAPVGIHKVVEMVASAFDMELDEIAEIRPGRKHEDQCYWISSEKMRRFGWEPQIPLYDGLRDMANWGRRYAEKLVTMPLNYEFRP